MRGEDIHFHPDFPQITVIMQPGGIRMMIEL
jgi:hypothetical protein